MTLFVIFQEDIKYAAFPPEADVGFEAVTLALLITFLVEIGERGQATKQSLAGGVAIHSRVQRMHRLLPFAAELCRSVKRLHMPLHASQCWISSILQGLI
jgi:hypothetical protein